MSELRVSGQITKVRRPWGSGADGGYWFNAGLAEAWGRLWLVARVNRLPSLLSISELDNNLQSVETPTLLFPASQRCVAAEDPRVILVGNKLLIYYVGILNNPACRVFRCEVDRQLQCSPGQPLLWRDRADPVAETKYMLGAGQEKNWVPFVQDGRELCIYGFDPLTILERTADGMRRIHQGTAIRWEYGGIRGGAPPVWHDGRWWVWFHSSRIEEDATDYQAKVYSVGLLTMDREFRPLEITPEPIMEGNVANYTTPWDTHGRISACFPCGAILRGDTWLVSYGWLDSEIRIAEIDTAELEKRLCPITVATSTAAKKATTTDTACPQSGLLRI
jgi:predicted GH43/DUF377 family glycosyl hydrolase